MMESKISEKMKSVKLGALMYDGWIQPSTHLFGTFLDFYGGCYYLYSRLRERKKERKKEKKMEEKVTQRRKIALLSPSPMQQPPNVNV